ncbi:MAG: DNA polymerase III subunit delta [Lachnospiraceae bacterium]|nr:DNA polymerase III subunit delta [Lachnospiraceae bacterium]
MKNIREHIKNQSFASCYLLYGSESYLKNLYRDKLVDALCGGRDSMNFARYEGGALDLQELAELAKTPPFLEERRVLLLENTGLFQGANEFAGMLAERAETTYLIFVEAAADKRNALYKFVKEQGYVAELNGLEESDLKLFVASSLKKDGLRISEQTIQYFLDVCGSDMLRLRGELAKLSAYCMGRDQVTKDDIDAICTAVIEGRVFRMMDAMMEQKQDRALRLYADLLALHEKPMQILYLLNKSFLQFSQVTALSEYGMSGADIAKQLSMAPFAVTKYQRLRRGFPKSRVKEALAYGTELERKIKTGDMDESIAVEMFLMRYSSQQAAE